MLQVAGGNFSIYIASHYPDGILQITLYETAYALHKELLSHQKIILGKPLWEYHSFKRKSPTT